METLYSNTSHLLLKTVTDILSVFKVVSRQNSFNPSAIKNFLQVREFHHQSKLIALIRTLQKEIHQNWTKWRLKADKWNGWLMNAGADTISLDKSTIESNRKKYDTIWLLSQQREHDEGSSSSLGLSPSVVCSEVTWELATELQTVPSLAWTPDTTDTLYLYFTLLLLLHYTTKRG